MKNFNPIIAATVIVLSITASITCALLYKFGKDKRVIYSHRKEYHQVIQNLFDKKIVENQPVSEVLKKYPPTKVSTHDNYLTLQYFEDNEEPEDCCVSYSYYVHIIVRDNKLVKAFATEGFFSDIDHVFFDILSESSEDDYWESRMNNAVAMSNI